MKRLKRFWVVAAVMVMVLGGALRADAMLIVSLQVHNPSQGSPSSNEPAGVKSQFVIGNLSDSLVNIDSVLWNFASPVFIDSTSAAPGVGGFRNYEVAPAGVYGGTGSGEFETTVSADSDILTGYTGPTSFTNGATSLLLTFNDFEPNEAFGFWTDLDGDSKGRVGNSLFNGSTTKITFADGSVIDYTWQLPDNNGRSFYAQVAAEADIPDETNAVPEPGTMLLFGSGMIGAFLRRRKIA